MKRTVSVFGIVIAVSQVACGGASGSSSTPTTPTNVLAVAGMYPTRAAVIADRNTCGAVTVQDNPTTVTHTAGGTDLSLVHAGSTYRGTVDNAGRFSTPPVNQSFPDGDYTISLSGQFSTTGFSAIVELTRRNGNVTCSYAVSWTGTKQGPPNTIPG